jgi:hypothetical protein
VESDNVLRFIGITLTAGGVIFIGAALITDIRVLWTIGPGLLGAGIALFALFGRPDRS